MTIEFWKWILTIQLKQLVNDRVRFDFFTYEINVAIEQNTLPFGGLSSQTFHTGKTSSVLNKRILYIQPFAMLIAWAKIERSE